MAEILKQVLLKAINKLLVSRVSSHQKMQLFRVRSEIAALNDIQYGDIRGIKFMGPKTYSSVMEILVRCYSQEVDMTNPVFEGVTEPSPTLITEPSHTNIEPHPTHIESHPKASQKTLKQSTTPRRPYIPPYNSLPYKILNLFNQTDSKLTRKQIQQKLPSDVNSALKTLLKRSLLTVEARQYFLTNEGHTLCNNLFKNQKINSDTEQINNITLLIDSREIKSKREQTFFQEEFLKRGIQISTRNLSVGDFTWIVKKEEEYLVPFLIERKCTQDFLASINTKRAYEQINRLKRYKNIFYLIETNGYKNLTDSDKSLFNKHINILKQSGLIVLETKDINESVELIHSIDTEIRQSFYNQPFSNELINYDLFELEASKNLNQKGRDVFKTLLSSVKGYNGNIDFIINSFKNLKDFFKKLKDKEYLKAIISEDPEFRKVLDIFL